MSWIVQLSYIWFTAILYGWSLSFCVVVKIRENQADFGNREISSAIQLYSNSSIIQSIIPEVSIIKERFNKNNWLFIKCRKCITNIVHIIYWMESYSNYSYLIIMLHISIENRYRREVHTYNEHIVEILNVYYNSLC